MAAMKGGHKNKHDKLKEQVMKDASQCDPKTEVLCEFHVQEVDCIENCEVLNIELVRKGNSKCVVEVKWNVVSDDAILGEHFNLHIDKIVFQKHVNMMKIPVEIVDDHDKNPDRHFQLQITEVNILDDSGIKPKMGDVKIIRITILDDDIPGYFEFSNPNYIVDESLKAVIVEIVRKEGTDGSIRVPY